MSKVITITLNPAVDKILDIPDFQTGGNSQASSSRSYPAGKGINVSRALECLGHTSVAVGIIGKADIGFFNRLSSRDILTEWILSEIPTRTNMTISDPVNHTETHIRENFDNPEPFPIREVEECLRVHCGSGDIVVISGSLPKNAPVDTLCRISSLCSSLGALVMVDSSKEPLNRALASSPFLIKPNLDELQELLDGTAGDYTPLCPGESISANLPYISRAARDISWKWDIGKVVVSLGADGAIAYDKVEDKTYHAALELDERDCQNFHSVGSGDAMIAGMCSSMLHGGDFKAMLAAGMAAGTANLFNDEPGVVDPDDVVRLLPDVSIRQL